MGTRALCLFVPDRIPPPKLQQFAYLQDVVSDAIALGIVAFAISVSMAKILAKKHDYDIDSNQVGYFLGSHLSYRLVPHSCGYYFTSIWVT